MSKRRPRPSQPPSPGKNRTPDPNNVRRTSNPKSPQEQVNAISDDIRTEVTEHIKNFYLESMITVDLIKSALNAQPSQIEETVKEFISGGKRVLNKATPEIQNGVYQANLPYLKKVSRDAITQFDTPESREGRLDQDKSRKKPRK